MKNKVVAITGGIGSGKSEVARYLNDLGYCTLDCDIIAKEIATKTQVVERVRALLGDEYVENGQLNRGAIRDKIFCDADLLKKYNAIFFDEVKRNIVERIERLDCNESDTQSQWVFVEISVFDAFDFDWDEVWLVDADVSTRVNRAQSRDSSSRQTLENIVSRQRICDHYTHKIINDGNLDELKAQVDIALRELAI